MLNTNFKNQGIPEHLSHTILISELRYITQSDGDPFEQELSQLNKEQKTNYQRRVYTTMKEMVDNLSRAKVPILDEHISQITNFIQTLTKITKHNVDVPTEIFLYVFNLSNIQKLIDPIFNFMLESFVQNPSLVNELFHNMPMKIDLFIDRFKNPFNNLHQNLLSMLINNKMICEQLICFGIVDNIQTAFLKTLESGQNFSDFWVIVFSLFNEIVKNCSNSVISSNILDLCLILLTDFYFQNARASSIEAMICIKSILTIWKENSFFELIEDYFPFIINILFNHETVQETQISIDLIYIISMDKNGIDLYTKPDFGAEKYIYQLINIFGKIDLFQFESSFAVFLEIVSQVLIIHPKLINFFISSNIIQAAFLLLKEGDCKSKERAALLFSRLCDRAFWDFTIDFFENNLIVEELFIEMQANLSLTSKIVIVHALVNLTNNMISLNRISSKIMEQFLDPLAIDSFNDLKNADDKIIIAEREMLDQNVCSLIKMM